MRLIFCSEPFSPFRVDSAFENEASAALAAGFEFDLINFETLTRGGSALAAVSRLTAQSAFATAIYRGWTLKPDVYSKLYDALLTRNIRLINSPAEYRHCHYLPESFSIIESCTPATVFVRFDADFDFDRVFEQLRAFGDKPLILKDYVKSRKHEWAEACFIPRASDRAVVERIVTRFLELQGEDLNEGLVFREFVEFEPLGAHAQSRMPLTKEFRLFFADGEQLACFEYWDEADYAGERLPANVFADVGQRIESRFFTMDVAQRTSGEWQIVELGDGQVAGLPDNADAAQFYDALKNGLAKAG